MNSHSPDLLVEILLRAICQWIRASLFRKEWGQGDVLRTAAELMIICHKIISLVQTKVKVL